MKSVKFGPITTIAMIVLILTACSGASSGKIEVQGAWVRAVSGAAAAGENANHAGMGMETPTTGGGMSMEGMNSAAYMLIYNHTNQVDRLLRVESDIAQAIELHKTTMENEIMTMRPVDSVEIPAGGQVALEPGGFHVMLIGLKQPLNAGQKITLTLVFEAAGRMEVEAEVRAP